MPRPDLRLAFHPDCGPDPARSHPLPFRRLALNPGAAAGLAAALALCVAIVGPGRLQAEGLPGKAGPLPFAMPGIGSHFPPLPAGAFDLGGSCTGATPELVTVRPDLAEDSICATAVLVLGPQFEGDDPPSIPPMAILAGRRHSPAGSATAIWEITDHLEIPLLPPEIADDFFLETAACTGAPAGQVAVAMVRFEIEAERFTDIRWARALDISSGRFVPLDPALLDCPNPMN